MRSPERPPFLLDDNLFFVMLAVILLVLFGSCASAPPRAPSPVTHSPAPGPITAGDPYAFPPPAKPQIP